MGAHRPTQTTLQRFQAFAGPLLHLIQPVIGFRQDVRQPAGEYLTRTQPVPVPMHLNMLVGQRRQLQFLQRSDQHGKIVYAFRYYSKLFGHADSLPYFHLPVKI